MTKYIINGGQILSGDIIINGSKNAILPIIAASIINKGTTRISNYPEISDVKIMLELLEEIGCQISYIKNNNESIIEIDSNEIHSSKINSDKTCKCRASSLLLGALLGRCHEAELSYPGGCIIGKRPLDLHKKAMEALGFEACFIEDEIKAHMPTNIDHSHSKHIYLNFPSVGATENALLAAAGINCEVHIYGAATEPEIQALGEFLTILGAEISGIGTSHIIIRGKDTYDNQIVTFKIIPDRIEAATYMILAAGIGSNLRIHGVNPTHVSSLTRILQQMGCIIKEYDTGCYKEKDVIYEIEGAVNKGRLKSPELLIARPYPEFPTDAQSLILPLLCISKGSTLVIDNVFPNRFKAAFELEKAGGKIIEKPFGIKICGKRHLHSARLNSYDLRGGAAMILASLFAKGQSEVYDDNYITRGYMNLVESLKNIGADISKTDE